MYKKLNFNSLEINSRQQIAFGADDDERYFIKVEILKNPNKTNDIKKEYEILKYLNTQESATVPTVYELGFIDKEELSSIISDSQLLERIDATQFYYIIQEYIPNIAAYHPADILLTMIEQKKLGVYQADVKPANIRFNPKNSVCYFVDYDQAIFLDEEEKSLNNLEFLDFCSEYDKNKHGIGDWLRHFPQYTHNDVLNQFKNNSLDLKNTSIFKTQVTTNTPNGIYHTINEKDIFIDGSRGMKNRARLLDQVDFKNGEKVLDVGCNSGLLSEYLDARACEVVGVDNDSRIVIAAKIIANILGKQITYKHLDLDDAIELDKFDTIMLFSVFHHTRDPIENAKKITQACSRIILETRLLERGKQPINGVWQDTSSWVFNTEQELVSFCERVFNGFELKKNLGKGDKNRYILEFVKTT